MGTAVPITILHFHVLHIIMPSKSIEFKFPIEGLYHGLLLFINRSSMDKYENMLEEEAVVLNRKYQNIPIKLIGKYSKELIKGQAKDENLKLPAIDCIDDCLRRYTNAGKERRTDDVIAKLAEIKIEMIILLLKNIEKEKVIMKFKRVFEY